MANPKNIPHGARCITMHSRDEYLAALAAHEAQGYVFVPCDDLKRLHWGALGIASRDKPVVWVRMPILHVIGEAGEEEQVGSSDESRTIVSENTMHLGDRIEEIVTDLFQFPQAFRDHKSRGHHLIEASDPLTYRLAFICVTCARIVRADWDPCIDLGVVLEDSVEETG